MENSNQGLQINFDEAPFIAAYEDFKNKKAEKAAAEKEAARQAEEKRISEILDRVKQCETPCELEQEFGITIVETAGHWSDLYEGRSGYAFNIGDRKDYEVLQIAIDYWKAEGEWNETKHRAGENHRTLGGWYSDLEDYQRRCEEHFNGDKYFFRSKESEAAHYIETVLPEILEDEMDAEEKMEAIIKAAQEWQEIEAGYYDCNGNLEISEATLNSPDFTGYGEDVYSYSFCYRLFNKNNWKEEEDEEE